jgi:hypothetical protein
MPVSSRLERRSMMPRSGPYGSRALRYHEGLAFQMCKVCGHHQCYQLRTGADVSRDALPPNVLFPSLKCEHVSSLAIGVGSLANDAAR